MSQVDLIKENLSCCMIPILTSSAQGTIDKDATITYDFIISIVPKETIDQTMKNSLNQFIVHLLTTLYETTANNSALSKYCK